MFKYILEEVQQFEWFWQKPQENLKKVLCLLKHHSIFEFHLNESCTREILKQWLCCELLSRLIYKAPFQHAAPTLGHFEKLFGYTQFLFYLIAILKLCSHNTLTGQSWILTPCLCPSMVLEGFQESTNTHHQNPPHPVNLHSLILVMVLKNLEWKNGAAILHQLNLQ